MLLRFISLSFVAANKKDIKKDCAASATQNVFMTSIQVYFNT